jgi:hypothetical protein
MRCGWMDVQYVLNSYVNRLGAMGVYIDPLFFLSFLQV